MSETESEKLRGVGCFLCISMSRWGCSESIQLLFARRDDRRTTLRRSNASHNNALTDVVKMGKTKMFLRNFKRRIGIQNLSKMIPLVKCKNVGCVRTEVGRYTHSHACHHYFIQTCSNVVHQMWDVRESWSQSMELLSRQRWTTGSTQQSNMFGMMPCICCIFFFWGGEVWQIGSIQLSYPTTKELHARS